MAETLSVHAPTAAATDAPFNADSTLVDLDGRGQHVISAVVSLFALTIYASYLWYRAAYTINADALVFSLLVYFAELHGFVSLALYFHQVWRRRGRRVVAPAPNQTVDVFVTTYNEEVDLPNFYERYAR